MRKRTAAALLLALSLLLCGAAPAPVGAESVPVEIDGLLSARGFLLDGQCYIPPRALCDACALDFSWGETDTGIEARIGPLCVQGERGRDYLMADGRYVWSPGGWLIRGEELYLPIEAVEKLFGVSAKLSDSRCAFSTRRAALLQGGEDFYALNFPADDYYWLTHIIHAEAGIEPLEGKIGVGNVVMNRVKSEIYPNTVFEVVYDTEHVIQFEPVAVGAIHEDPDPESVAAACLVLEGADVVGEDCLYFVNPAFGSAWFDRNLTLVCVIGRHNFYRDERG